MCKTLYMKYLNLLKNRELPDPDINYPMLLEPFFKKVSPNSADFPDASSVYVRTWGSCYCRNTVTPEGATRADCPPGTLSLAENPCRRPGGAWGTSPASWCARGGSSCPASAYALLLSCFREEWWSSRRAGDPNFIRPPEVTDDEKMMAKILRRQRRRLIRCVRVVLRPVCG